MNRSSQFFSHAATAAVGLSGIAYGAMKYLLVSSDPYSRVGHPWQEPALKVHILAAPFLIFMLGFLLNTHAFQRLRSPERTGRFTGLTALGLATPLILTGVLIQALTGDVARRWTGWAHAAVGVIYILVYLGHLLKKRPANATSAIQVGHGGLGRSGPSS